MARPPDPASPASFLPSSGVVTRLTLLGLLSLRSMHGYEIRREIELRHMHRWADVRPGSIYAALRRLVADGLLTELDTRRNGRRPPRTTFAITAEGREELERLLHEAWAVPRFAASALDVALMFAWSMPRDAILTLLERRLAALDATAGRLDQACERALAHQRTLNPLGYAIAFDLFEHGRRRLRAEREWADYLRGRLRRGVYHQLDSSAVRAWWEAQLRRGADEPTAASGARRRRKRRG